jgi:hypothetical protein
MSLASRIEKLEKKLTPEKEKIYYIGWANSTWSESEGLTRQQGESKDDFCDRVYQATKKQFLWFD